MADEVNGVASSDQSLSTLFSSHVRQASASLPQWRAKAPSSEKEKLGRGRWDPRDVPILHRVQSFAGLLARRAKFRIALALVSLLIIGIIYLTPLWYVYQRSSFLGGGSKFVIVLASNEGGGVMEWKGAKEWAIERESIDNKKAYARRWGYDLEIVDMMTRKRYAHEWRESWEKVDVLKNAFHKYPQAEWLWWLDLNTFIMEPGVSLQQHVFRELGQHTYRDINEFNPLKIDHPLNQSYLSEEERSPIGDGDPNSINILIPQDCGGFNLGSFMIRRSDWTDRLLDVWWDPVHYEQKHMEWEHKEQDALEYMYREQPWIRPHVGFVSQRLINSFPPGACGDPTDGDPYHYSEKDRDFLVNMAGCNWGRDCWAELRQYDKLSNRLNRGYVGRWKDWIRSSLKF